MTSTKKSVLYIWTLVFVQIPMQEFPTHFQERGKFLTVVLCHSCSNLYVLPRDPIRKLSASDLLVYMDDHAFIPWGNGARSAKSWPEFHGMNFQGFPDALSSSDIYPFLWSALCKSNILQDDLEGGDRREVGRNSLDARFDFVLTAGRGQTLT